MLDVQDADHGDLRHDLPSHQTAADTLVSGDASAEPVEEQRIGAGTQAPCGRSLQDGLADEAQADAGDECA